jgi:ribonuclease/clavin/mitogillin
MVPLLPPPPVGLLTTVEPLQDGVWRVHAPGVTLKPYVGTECYFVGGPNAVWLVDTGDGGPDAQSRLEAAWRDLGSPRVELVLVTHGHRDHYGGAAWAAGTFGAPVAAHPLDLDRVREVHAAARPIDAGTHRVGDVRVELLHVPGHTPGQINVWLPRQRVLLSGDNVLGDTTSVVVPPDGDLRVYRQTLARLRALDPQMVGPGHGSVVRDPVRWIGYYQQHRADRERQLLDLLRTGPRTVPELAAAIYGQEVPETFRAGQLMILGHLVALSADGVVEEGAGGTWRTATPGSP